MHYLIALTVCSGIVCHLVVYSALFVVFAVVEMSVSCVSVCGSGAETISLTWPKWNSCSLASACTFLTRLRLFQFPGSGLKWGMRLSGAWMDSETWFCVFSRSGLRLPALYASSLPHTLLACCIAVSGYRNLTQTYAFFSFRHSALLKLWSNPWKDLGRSS